MSITKVSSDLIETLPASALDSNAVTTAKIADDAVTTAKIQDNSVIPAKLSTEAKPFSSQLFHAQDQKSSGTDGGTFTAGDWRTRDINTTVTNEITGASLASNQITLPAGTYYIEARSPVYSGGSALSNHQARLRDITGSSDLLLGSSEIVIQGAASTGSSGRSYISGRFTLSVESDLEIQHRCTVTASNNGFGAGAGFGTEVFTDVKIWKVG